MNKRYIASILGILLIAGATYAARSGVFKKGSTAKNNHLQIIVSFYPLYFFSKSIAGDRADVANVTPAGAEPHDYEPTPQDVARMEDSNILVLNGAHLEAWGDKIKDILKSGKTDILTVGEGLATKQVMEEGQLIQDPHVWLAPALARQEAERILAELIKIDPAGQSYYEANAEALYKKLADLDTAYKDGLKNCSQKDIVTSHTAFGYMAAAYGLTQVSITGISPDSEPSAQDLAKVAELARTNHIHYIFFESLVSPKLSETIAREVGAQTLVLDPIEGLSDADMAAGKDYFTKMRANLANLELALGCKT